MRTNESFCLKMLKRECSFSIIHPKLNFLVILNFRMVFFSFYTKKMFLANSFVKYELLKILFFEVSALYSSGISITLVWRFTVSLKCLKNLGFHKKRVVSMKLVTTNRRDLSSVLEICASFIKVPKICIFLISTWFSTTWKLRWGKTFFRTKLFIYNTIRCFYC